MKNEKQSGDPNPMPEIHLFEVPLVVKKVAHAIGSLLSPFHCEPRPSHSTHFHGAGPALDHALYDQQPLPFEGVGDEQ